METTHRVVVDDASDLSALDDDAVELVVTSPPYPMVEMWDDLFADLDPDVGEALAAGDGRAAFEAMHRTLDPVWSELARVVADGGVVCVVVGDATRTVGDRFRVYQNHVRVTEALESRGFDPLPEVLWRKPTNSAAKFMGSGMIPPNAYVTLEHEHVLVFRNGDRRRFDPGADRRYEAAYFWEERNRWFSDVWTDLRGERQSIADPAGGDDGDDPVDGRRSTGDAGDAAADDRTRKLRDRSGAFPFAVPYRLVNMYSVYGDAVLDPFWGTGTTSLAALVAGRNSVGYELDGRFAEVFDDRVDGVEARSRAVARRRLADHRAFVAGADDRTFDYRAEHYDVPVTTAQERSIRLYAVEDCRSVEPEGPAVDRCYRATHRPVEGVPDPADRDADRP